MKSLDTNVLLYASNADCVEYTTARDFVAQAIGNPGEWIVADQVYLELYRLLRNRSVLPHPLSSLEASQAISWYRERSGWLHCAYEHGMMKLVSEVWSEASFVARNTFDLVLAVTLAKNGVREFYTRNSTDFLSLGLFDIINPIDGT